MICPGCDGNGYVRSSNRALTGFLMDVYECARCIGTGEVPPPGTGPPPCPRCDRAECNATTGRAGPPEVIVVERRCDGEPVDWRARALEAEALAARLREAREALRIVAPMAAGWAAEHPVGSNDEYVAFAFDALAATKEETE